MQVRGSGPADAPVPVIAAVDSLHDDGPVTTVVAGTVTISLPRVVGAPVEGDAILTGHIGDDSRVLTLAAVRRLP